MHRASFPTSAVVLGGRFVLAMKNIGNKDIKDKDRSFFQGDSDKEDPGVMHHSSTMQMSSTKVLISTCAVMGFRIFSPDVNQAYLQSMDNICRPL